MSQSVPELTVRGFLDSVAARTAAPGGGAVAAVTVGAAAALVAMSARFANGDLAELAGHADRLRAEVVALADTDADAYGAVLDAYRSPKEQPRRHARITAALKTATEVPLRIARVGSEVAGMAARLAAEGNRNLAGDACTASALAQAATRAAATLVRINVEAGNLDRGLVSEADACVARCGEPP